MSRIEASLADPPVTPSPGVLGADVASPRPRSPQRRRIASDALFQGQRELVIEHTGKEYVLRITRQGKLILTA
jgi:hemin uptake protein HemP